MTFKKKIDNTEAPVVKKGTKATFRPSHELGRIEGVPDGYVPRWCRNEEKNLYNKQKEGWIPLNKSNSAARRVTNSQEESSHVKDSQPLGSVVGTREMVAMVLPQELKEAREEYFKEQTRIMTEAKLNAKDQRNKPGGSALTKATIMVD